MYQTPDPSPQTNTNQTDKSQKPELSFYPILQFEASTY